MKDDKYMRDMFKDIDEDIQLDIEESILLQLNKEKDHSVVLSRYKKMSKVGLYISISLAIILTIIYIIPVFLYSNINEDDSLSKLLPTVYAVLILLFLYIQIEVFKSSRFHLKDKALQN